MLVAMSFGVAGQAPLAWVVERIGWRTSLLAAGAYGAALAALIWLVVRDRPGGRTVPTDQGAPVPILPGLKKVLASPRNWVLAAYAGTMSGPMLAYAGLWGVPHMMQRYGVERPTAAATASVLFIGWAVGSPLAGWISDRLGRRKLPLVVGAALTTVGWLIHLYVPLPLAAVSALMFFIGVVSSAMVVAYAMAREIATHETAGALTGFVNMATVGMGAVMQPVIGLLLDANWQGEMVDGARWYGGGAYDIALLTIPACCAIAIVSSLATRESFGAPRP
jgi:MFS family permease